jgi:site-specific recombinase XerD
MEVFLSPSTIAISLIIIGLSVFLTKASFGLWLRKNQKKGERNKVQIKNGKIILPVSCDENQADNPGEIRQAEQAFTEKPTQQINAILKKVTPNRLTNLKDHGSRLKSAAVQAAQESPATQEKPRAIKGKSKKNQDIEVVPGAKANSEVIHDEELVDLVVPEEATDQVQIAKGRLPKIDRFWSHLEVAGRAKRTIQEYKYEWKWWQKEAALKRRTPYTLRVAEMEEILKGKDPSTTKRKIALLRTLAKWYLREGHPKLHSEAGKLTSPRLPKRIPKDKGAEQFEILRDKARMLIAENNRVGLWIALKLICGLRISEIQTAKIAGRERVQVMGKGSKERLVPAPRWVILAMKNIKEDGKGGWRKDRKLIWFHLAKIELKNPHSLRHTCASELLRRDMKLEEIKEFLGHENIGTTNIYARAVVPDRAAKLLDQ